MAQALPLFSPSPLTASPPFWAMDSSGNLVKPVDTASEFFFLFTRDGITILKKRNIKNIKVLGLPWRSSG